MHDYLYLLHSDNRSIRYLYSSLLNLLRPKKVKTRHISGCNHLLNQTNHFDYCKPLPWDLPPIR